MKQRGFPPEIRLYAHSQGYDMVERPMIRADETMPIEANMNFAVHPGYDTATMWTTICDNYMVGSERRRPVPAQDREEGVRGLVPKPLSSLRGSAHTARLEPSQVAMSADRHINDDLVFIAIRTHHAPPAHPADAAARTCATSTPRGCASAFPQLQIDVVDHFSKARAVHAAKPTS